MRHRLAKVRLSRPTAHRAALMRNLVTALIEHERIETTLVKAKQLRRIADRAVTWGKEGTLNSRRRALGFIRQKEAVSKLFTTLSERFKDRAGGYTRIIKLGFRQGDGAPMAIVEYLGYALKAKVKEEKGMKAPAAPQAKKAKPKKEKKAKEKKEKETTGKKEKKSPAKQKEKK